MSSKAILIFILIPLTLLAVNIDSGWQTYSQPNGKEFIGREFGDEFEYYQETQEGYRFVFDNKTGYWVYAELSEIGELIPSNHKVGIVRSPALAAGNCIKKPRRQAPGYQLYKAI